MLACNKGLGILDGLVKWKNHSSPCKWTGESYKRDFVMLISFLYIEPKDSISPNLGNIDDFKLLNFTKNPVVGSIPKEIFGLSI